MAGDYTSDDPVQRLAAVRAAIAATLQSQEYQIGSRRKQMSQLNQLYQLEQSLMAQVAAANGTNVTVLSVDYPS